MTGLTQAPNHVTLDTSSAGAGTTHHRASFVVGADGVRSTVRSSAGLPFPGRSVVRSIMLADVRLTDPPADVLAVNATGGAFAFVAPFGDGWYRVFAWDRRRQVDGDAPVDLDEIRSATRRALGSDLGMHDPRWMGRFHSDERQVPGYRRGRVLLTGDAAHVHSPAGGQGMNVGLQDSANLAWKLAAVCRATAPDELLDTYQAERHPVGAQVLRTSGALIRMAMLRSTPARWARNAVVASALRLPAVQLRVARTISGIGVRYPAPAGSDPMVGRWAGELLPPARDLAPDLAGGRYALVANDRPAWLPDEVRLAPPGVAGAAAVLVRPDGYVGWAGDPSTVHEGWSGVTPWVSPTATSS